LMFESIRCVMNLTASLNISHARILFSTHLFYLT
jgi:hypothetical protein